MAFGGNDGPEGGAVNELLLSTPEIGDADVTTMVHLFAVSCNVVHSLRPYITS
jgi:hypothetical protein